LFAQTVDETKGYIEAHLQIAINSNSSRRVEALEIVTYLLGTLETDMKSSRRILNDLRSIRRLLLGERANLSISAPARVSRSAVSGSTVALDAGSRIRVKRRALSSDGSRDGRTRNAGEAAPWYVRPDRRPTYEPTTVKAA
jgi:hypothetical protein